MNKLWPPSGFIAGIRKLCPCRPENPKEIWTIGKSVMIKTAKGCVSFTLKDVYYKDDYEYKFDCKRGDTLLVVKYTVDVLEAAHPICSEFLDLYWMEGDLDMCEVLTDSLKYEMYGAEGYGKFLKKGQSMNCVCGYSIPKRMIKRGKKLSLSSILDEVELSVEILLPLEDAENRTGKDLW